MLLTATISVALSAAAAVGAQEVPVFDPAEHEGLLELADAEVREDLSASLVDAGRNWQELAEAVTSLEGERRDACIQLINSMPHLDRLEMTGQTLIEHVTYAFLARDEMPYPVPEEMFEPYILTYRIEEEPVDPWRRELYEMFAPVARVEGSVVGTARTLNARLARTLDERDWEFFGPRQSPLLTLRSGAGTRAEIAILACAMMKAVGIPSRQVAVQALGEETDGASWIEVCDGEDWLPLYPLEPNAFGDRAHVEREHAGNVTVAASRSAFERLLVTERYTETGVVDFTFVSGDAPAGGFEHFSVSVLNNGSLVPLDALEAVADEEGRFEAVVGEGRYVALAGVRDASGNPYVMMEDIEVPPGGRRHLVLDVTPRDAPEAYDREKATALGHVVTALVLFDPDGEPSIRMLPLIAAAAARRAPTASVLYAYRSSEAAAERVRRLEGEIGAPLVEIGAAAGRFITPEGWAIELPGGDAELPAVRLYDTASGDVLMRHAGYDLNIGRKVGEAIDAHVADLLAGGCGTDGP